MEVRLCKANYCFDWAVGMKRPAVCSRCNENRSHINNHYHLKMCLRLSYWQFSTMYFFSIKSFNFCTIINPHTSSSSGQQSHPDTCQTALLITWVTVALVTAPKPSIVSPYSTALFTFCHITVILQGLQLQQHQSDKVFRTGLDTPRQPSLLLMSVGLQICS